MSIVHFLNVNEGSCSIIVHNSGHVTAIDVSNAAPEETVAEAALARLGKMELGARGNFNQKKYPVNPVTYMKSYGISSIFRYIQTHPDMDHMDGIGALFDQFAPINFWDTNNRKVIGSDSWSSGRYSQEDWKFYQALRKGTVAGGPKRLALLAGAEGKYFNVAADGRKGGDGLYVLAPTKELLATANRTEEYNNCSYVILYRTGDSANCIWRRFTRPDMGVYFGRTLRQDVSNVDLLIEPHHGRKSGRSHEFLDALRPSLTLFRNARSEHLAYAAWNYGELPFITNNQANCIVTDINNTSINVFVTNETFARAKKPRERFMMRSIRVGIFFRSSRC